MQTLNELSVLIPSWRRPDMLRQCLEGISRLDAQPREVLVVARSDDEATLDVIASSPIAARWVKVSTPGNVAPIISGLQAAKTELLAIIDDDAVPRQHWLTELQSCFEDSQVACVGGHAPTPSGRPPRNSHPGTFNWYGRVGVDIAQIHDGPIREVDTVQECNWAWRTDVLRSIKFDEAVDTEVAANYGLDLTLSAKAAGWRVLYNPNAIVDHYSASSGEFREARSRSYVRNITLITLKHAPARKRVLYLTWALLVGERAAPGIITAIAEAAMRKPYVKERIRASVTGRYEGLRLWMTRSCRQ